MGCGTCVAACPAKAIRMQIDSRKGIHVPTLNKNKCSQCGRCIEVCPGWEVDFTKLSKIFLEDSNYDEYLGTYISCYFGHACNQDVRRNSSSGGLVTSLLIYALENGLIHGAVVTGMSKTNPLKTKVFLAESKKQIIEASGSKYCPSSIGAIIPKLKNSKGQYAFVGLPCQIHGLRKLQQKDKELQDKVILVLGIYCANNNTYLGTEYFLKKNRIPLERVQKIQYRSGGWPGLITVGLKNGETRQIQRGTTETSPKRKMIFSSAFHYDFMIPRCLLCSDLTCELADISLADPWNKIYLGKETVGKSMIVTRSRKGQQLLTEAMKDNVISLNLTDVKTVNRSQNTSFKRAVGSRLFLRKRLRLKNPNYKGKQFFVNIQDIFTYFYYGMSYLSYHRGLWPLLGIIQRIRKESQNMKYGLFTIKEFIVRKMSRKAR